MINKRLCVNHRTDMHIQGIETLRSVLYYILYHQYLWQYLSLVFMVDQLRIIPSFKKDLRHFLLSCVNVRIKCGYTSLLNYSCKFKFHCSLKKKKKEKRFNNSLQNFSPKLSIFLHPSLLLSVSWPIIQACLS